MDNFMRYLLLDGLNRKLMYMKYPQLNLVYLEPLRKEIEEEMTKLLPDKKREE